MNSRKLILLLILSYTINQSFAQITFQKTFGESGLESGLSTQQTFDGGYIIAGLCFNSNITHHDFYLIKTNATGDTLWTKTYGGTNDDKGFSVQQTADGGYIMCGQSNSFGAGDVDVYLIKTDFNGNPIWTRTYGRSSADHGNSVKQTSDGGYVLCGNTRSNISTDVDIYIIKTDANGDTLWTKTFGGPNDDFGNDIQPTADGGLIIIGSTYSFGLGYFEILLIKTDASGNVLWSKTFGENADDLGISVLQTSDGGYFICGASGSFTGVSADMYLIKIDFNGDIMWSKSIGGVAYDSGRSTYQTTDDGYIVTGATSSFGAGSYDVYLVRLDSNGDTLWTKSFGGTGHDEGFSVKQTTDGGFIIAGATNSFGAGSFDIFLIKTDSLGNSGCYDYNTATLVSNSPTQGSNPSIIVGSPSTMVSNPTTTIGIKGIITTLCYTVNTNDIYLDRFLDVFPNPSSGEFIISLKSMILKGEVYILNLLGQNVYTKSISNESKIHLKLNNILKGVYFLKVFDGRTYYFKTIIIE